MTFTIARDGYGHRIAVCSHCRAEVADRPGDKSRHVCPPRRPITTEADQHHNQEMTR